MTNILLSIIAVLLFARIVLQIRQGKRAVEKGYAAPSEVENVLICVPQEEVESVLNERGSQGFELVHVSYNILGDVHSINLFFTRKKIKTYYD